MADYKNFLKIAELGLDGKKEELLATLSEIAAKEINKNRHSLYKGLVGLLDSYSEGSSNITTSGYQPATNEVHYPSSDIWISPRVEDKLRNFIEFHKARRRVGGTSLNHLNKILLHGPPGTGKTVLGFHIARLLKKDLQYVKISDVISSRFGETLKNISDIFTTSTEEIIFIDEFDAFAKSRTDSNDVGELKRIVNSIIQTLDFHTANKIVLVSTNLVDSIDPAILRRFPFRILVDFLTEEERRDFLNFLIANDKSIRTDVDTDDIVFLLKLLELRTIDEIKTFFEKALISSHIGGARTLKFEDFLGVFFSEGQLRGTTIRQIKKEDPQKLSKLGKYLEKRGYPKKRISELFGIHRNSYDNYIR